MDDHVTRPNTKRSRKLPLLATLVLLALVLCLAYWWLYLRRPRGIGVIPLPPPEQLKLSDQQPQNPFAQVAPGVATRTLFATEEGAPYRLEIQDVILAPGQPAATVPIAGAAIVEVVSGLGEASVGNQRRELKANSSFAVTEGETLSLRNSGDQHLELRLLVAKAR